MLTNSPEEMMELGRQIGKTVMPGEGLGVVGELGAGTTHLTQGTMEGLGSSDAAASSPTTPNTSPGIKILPICRPSSLISSGE